MVKNTSTTEKQLDEARARLRIFAKCLPTVVDPASISLSAKIPYKATCFREALIWRAEELGRTACEHYERGDVIAAILLTRGLTETAAAVWYLKELIERQLASGIETDLDEKMMALLMGHKNLRDMPQAINVLKFLDRVDKAIPGFRKSYDSMSEYAHPNWAGTSYVYSKDDRQRILTNFGRGIQPRELHAEWGLKCLVGSLQIFEFAYNEIADLMPRFIAACEADLERRR
jgi:hypothetical protein